MEQFTAANGSIVTIRPARSDDEPTLTQMACSEDMEGLRGFDDTLVAEDDYGIAGFCRVRTYRGEHYVNPIITAPRVRGCHVGVALMRASLAAHGRLKFVARGYAVPFYKALGCAPTTWRTIAPEIAEDCATCAHAGTCHPLPMIYE